MIQIEDDCEHLDIAESGAKSEMKEVVETTLFRNKHNCRNVISAPILILHANQPMDMACNSLRDYMFADILRALPRSEDLAVYYIITKYI